MIDAYEVHNASILGVQEVDKENTDKYGIIDGKKLSDNIYKVNALVEKPDPDQAPSNVAILGRYIITPQIFDILGQIPPGKNGEIQLTDALEILKDREDMYAYVFEGRRYDLGDKLGFLQATVDAALKNQNLEMNS